jgi:ATP-dependent DNA helicase RecG
MTAYADLDFSVIDELPPGRQPIETVVLSDQRRDEVIARVYQACRGGRQSYWVCTLIEESEQLQCQAAQDTAQQLGDSLKDLTIGLIHGRMKPEEKQKIMSAFKAGVTDLLVATTVIEVGVDVPNATLMIIENAERLGLSQLHQLRGRVGRGSKQSVCVLMYHPPLSKLAATRLEIMRETTDGFELAKRDLELRGPGELLGTRQTGLVQYHIADLQKHQHMLTNVRQTAEYLQKNGHKSIDPLINRWIGQRSIYADV